MGINYFTKITVWENKKRLEDLNIFRTQVIDYFNDTNFDDFGELDVGKSAMKVRTSINLVIVKIGLIIRASGVNPVMEYTPPPMIGGRIMEIDLISNIFNIHNFRIPPQEVIDIIEKSIGVYQENIIPSLIRTINPFFWLKRMLSFVGAIPFEILEAAGFPMQKAKSSFLGKTIRLIIELAAFSASVLGIMQILEYKSVLESIKQYLDQLLRIF